MPTADDSTVDPDICAGYLKGLADPVRLQLVRALQSGSMSVSDLSELLELDLSVVSHHLRVLFHAKIVTTEREGKYIYYTVNRDLLKNRTVAKSLDFGCCRLDLRG